MPNPALQPPPETSPQGRSPNAVLELEGIDIPFPADPESVLVRNVQWRVLEGECWLIGGPAGAGKSSVLNVAAGLIRPLRGVHRMFGANMTALSEDERVERRLRVGVVFGRGGRLFSRMTVAENLALPLRYHHFGSPAVIGARVEEVLDSFGLMPHAHRLARDLSQRVAQRVALARALALQPEVLVLDDPTTGLVTEESRWWAAYARDALARERPRTLLLATTDRHAWMEVATRFAWVERHEWTILDADLAQQRLLRLSAGD